MDGKPCGHHCKAYRQQWCRYYRDNVKCGHGMKNEGALAAVRIEGKNIRRKFEEKIG